MSQGSRDASYLAGVTLLGRFVVGERIGQGGMGAVFEANDLNLDAPAIVKVPHARYRDEPGFAHRFAREVDELIRLKHPNVVRVLARGEHEGTPFFVLEHLGGGSLSDRLLKVPEQRQPVEDLLAWLRPIALALDYVNTAGVIHRDVKPANILFDEEGHPYLADFGLVKLLDNESAKLTHSGEAIGTPSFMAPEQAVGRDVTPATDQYALAATVYAALGGTRPYEPGTPVEILVRKQQEDPVPLEKLRPELPAAAAAAVRRALSREPAHRFPTCRAFADALEAALRDRTSAVPAPLPGSAEADGERARGPRAVPWTLATLLALTLIGVALVAGRPPADPAPAGPPPTSAEAPAPQEAAAAATSAAVGAEQRREAERLGVPVAFENTLGMRFVLIPSGTFTMGSPASESGRDDDETPHEVTLSRPYYLQSTEVTNAQYRRFRPGHVTGSFESDGQTYVLNGDDQPVVNVSWEDAQAFVSWLNDEEPGAPYRLPTEAEWERAARAGTQTRFSFGDRAEEFVDHGNFADVRTRLSGRDASLDDGHASTAPVGSYSPSPWGLYDMHGNVWEWVGDWYGPYPPGSVRDPAGPVGGKYRVYRSGSWFYPVSYARAANRYRNVPQNRYAMVGFRLARDVAP